MIITDIKQQVKNDKRYSVFIDGEFAFGISGVDVLYYKLKIGDEITPGKCNEIMEEAIFGKARDKAARLITFKPRTEKEIRQRLLEDEYPSEAVDRVINIFEKYGYINDEKYAKDYVADCLKLKGYGAHKIKYELHMKGVCDEYIEMALEGTENAQEEKAYVLLEKRLKGRRDIDYKERKKHSDYLARKGYSYDIINAVFKRLIDENNDYYE